VSTSRAPARATLLLGFFFSALGILGAIATFSIFLFNRNEVQVGVPTLIVTVLFFGGLQLLFLGLIGEYVLSIHNQVRPRPPVFELEKINFPREFMNRTSTYRIWMCRLFLHAEFLIENTFDG
jgi:hypothetical protein